MALEFREVTEENFDEFIALEVKSEQAASFWFRSPKPNTMSLAQAYIFEGSEIYAIYDGKAMVGSIFYSPDTAPPGKTKKAWLIRFMIDKRHQGKGLGKAAMELLFERIRKERGKGTSLGLSYEPENVIAENLYKSLGFKFRGKVVQGQKVVWKRL